MLDVFYATKLSSTQAFDDKADRLVVTQLKAVPMTVTQIKTKDRDGYWAVQCCFPKTAKKFWRREIKLIEESNLKPGDQIKVSQVFKAGDLVKLTASSKGRGFSGVVKRWGFAGGPKTHGQSDRHRAPGSIGMRTTPGRVWKGKKMAGHYGTETVTVRNLKILTVDDDQNLLTVSGTVPGSRHSLVKITRFSS